MQPEKRVSAKTQRGKVGANSTPNRIDTVPAPGRQFILTEEIVRFWQRVKAGEFAKRPRGAAKARRVSSPLPGHEQAQDGHTSARSTSPRPDVPPSGQ